MNWALYQLSNLSPIPFKWRCLLYRRMIKKLYIPLPFVTLCGRSYTVMEISVRSNTFLIISSTLLHSSLSRPAPILGMERFRTAFNSQCRFILFSELSKVLYVGFWKYLSFVTWKIKGPYCLWRTKKNPLTIYLHACFNFYGNSS